MRLVDRHREARFGVVRVLSAFVFAVVPLATFAASANASPALNSSGVATSSLCSVARGVAKDIVNSTSVTKAAALSPADLKTTYEKIAAAEPALLASASGPIKRDLKPVFRFVNVLVADLKKVNWRIAGLAPQFTTLTAGAAKIQPQLNAAQAYFKKTCKLAV